MNEKKNPLKINVFIFCENFVRELRANFKRDNEI